MAPNVLFICGSLNQTSQMHAIAREMGGSNSFFAPFFADGIEALAARAGLLDSTVLGGRHLRDTRHYLAEHGLAVDERGVGRDYDLVVTCSDLIVPRNVRRTRLVLVQDGVTEPEGKLYCLCKTLPCLPCYLANTAATGLSNAYDLFCVASQGYTDHFARKGVRPDKIAVTGIPNFDNLRRHRENDFPFRGYVLVATTPFRETWRGDDRQAFLRRCGEISSGRPLLFKLHPLENSRRARREIHRFFPGAPVLTHGDINPMIANAAVVITQQSSCTFAAVALGKETYSYLDLCEIRQLIPIQNGGESAGLIAALARRLLCMPIPTLRHKRVSGRIRSRWEADLPL